MEKPNRSAKFDLTLNLTETVQGLTGAIEYNADLFERSSIQRLIGQFTTLLESILKNPEESIDRLNIARPEQSQNQLNDDDLANL